MKLSVQSLLLSTALLIPTQALAGDKAKQAETLAEALTDGQVTIGARYRVETVDQDNLPDNALASTLRTTLGYKTKSFKGFSAVVEVENISYIGDDDFNDTLNGKGTRPIVADPEGTEINQAYIKYNGFKNAEIFAGRKAYKIGNQRIVGSVPWRQNHQTLDMVGANIKPNDKLKLGYGYAWNVNRILGDDHPRGNIGTTLHMANADYSFSPQAKLSGYAVLYDAQDAGTFGLSTQTFGAVLKGGVKTDNGKFGYHAEYARQSDYGDNPANFDADYFHLFGNYGNKVGQGGLALKAGIEQLGSDNGRGFATPLGTVHLFNGWADRFIATPGTGLRDLYLGGSYKVGGDSPLNGVKFDAIYHDFASDDGDNYGSEIDLQVTKKLNKHVYSGLKYANYSADGFGNDTQKLWFTLGANFK